MENNKIRPDFHRTDKAYRNYDAWLRKRFGWKHPEARSSMVVPAPWNADGKFLADPDTGECWIEFISTRNHLQQLENSLRTACYIVLAFMTGARNTEMNQLKTNCITELKQANGRPSEYYIQGIVTKFRGAGQEVKWGVLPIAAKAVKLLMDMCVSWRDRTEIDRLFVTQTGHKMNDSLVNIDLKVFLERIKAPYFNEKPYPLTTHQFRVALAQFLAADPLGEIVGAYHLQQLRTSAFRGYLREDPSFQSYYNYHEVQTSADHLAMLSTEPVLAGRKGKAIAALRTPETQAKLEADVRELTLARAGREAPSARVLKNYKVTGQPVYITQYSTCVFRADSAECLKDIPVDQRLRPATHRCNPLTCANSAIARPQIPAYLENLEGYHQMAEDLTSSPSQVDLANDEIAKLEEIVFPFTTVLISERKWILQALPGIDERESEAVALRKRLNTVNDLIKRLLALGAKEGSLE